MNQWKIGQIPYSWAPKDITVEWSGTDSIDNLNKNPQRANWDNVDIAYQYNPQGFRCPDLNNFLGKQVNIALGCSFTEGVGLPVESVWPSIVEQHTEYPVLNLGIGGGATDSVARILTNISGLFDIQTVYILWPPFARLEHYMLFDLDGNVIFKNGKTVKPVNATHGIGSLHPMHACPEHVWALTDEMNTQRFNQNQLIVELLSKNFGFSIVQTTVDNIIFTRQTKGFGYNDFARDGCHWGANTQKVISKIMIDNQ